jgi:subfamily B ATP-binding cassette protein MsbA
MPKVSKISRKDLANLDTRQTIALAREVYSKLFAYMKPYRMRFFMGIFFGVLSGFSNAVMVFGFKIIFTIVLPVSTDGKEAMKPIAVPFVKEKVDVMAWLTEHLGFLGFHQHAAMEGNKTAMALAHTLNPDFHPAAQGGGNLSAVIFACCLVPLLFLLRGGLTYIGNYCMMWVGNRILLDLRNDAYRSLMSQSVGYFSRQKVGNLVQTVFNQARVAQQNLVTLSQDIVQRPVAILSLLIYLISDNPEFTLYSLLVFPLCIGPVIMVGKKVRKSGTQEELEAGQMLVQMSEAFGGIRVVKSYAREEYECKRFASSNRKMNKVIMRYGKALEIVGTLVETVASFGVAVGLFYAYKKGITSSDFMVLVAGLTQIYPHAKALSRIQLLMQKTIVATSTVFATMEEVPEVRDAPDAVKLSRVKGRLHLENVTFTYKKDGDKDGKGKGKKSTPHPAVDGITLDLQPGNFYALVGPSGAGKSTLFSLILRFYDPDKGYITLDEHDIRRVTQESLRNQFAVVSQDTFLFHASIMENIRYGRLNAKDEEIIEAAKKAHAHEFITLQERGYDTEVGDMGGKLSGGQKQRISIARAILRNAPILLLDEATSALDTESEKVIKDALHTLTAGKTVIAIAHRLSTILEANQIIVMRDGRVLDVGPHAELLQRCELYQRLYQLQFESGNVDPAQAVGDISLDESFETPVVVTVK